MELKTLILIQLSVYSVTMVISEPRQENYYEDMMTSDEKASKRLEDQTMADFNPVLPQLDASDCQFMTIKKCNHKFKSMFHGLNRRAAANDRELYCKGMQTFMDCIEGTACRGKFIDHFGYVILQHGMMDKKTNYCPNHSYGKLRSKIQSIVSWHRFIDDIGSDSSSACSIQTHLKCVNEFTSEMKTNSNMCQDVQTFLNCYKKESPKCHSNLTQHFAHLCLNLGENMLKANERHRGMMC